MVGVRIEWDEGDFIGLLNGGGEDGVGGGRFYRIIEWWG